MTHRGMLGGSYSLKGPLLIRIGCAYRRHLGLQGRLWVEEAWAQAILMDGVNGAFPPPWVLLYSLGFLRATSLLLHWAQTPAVS